MNHLLQHRAGHSSGPWATPLTGSTRAAARPRQQNALRSPLLVRAEGGPKGGRGGGSRGGGGRGGGGGKGKDKVLKPSFLTPPVENRVGTILTGWEKLPRPMWSTFTGSCSGVWKGVYVALSPVDGDPEPLLLDGKQKVRLMRSLTTEARETDPELGDILRRTERRLNPTAALDSAPDAELSEPLRQADLGLVCFEDGSYSSGPMRLGIPVGLDELDFTVARNPLTGRMEEEDEDEGDTVDFVIDEIEMEGESDDEEGEDAIEGQGIEITDGVELDGEEGEDGEEDSPIYVDAEDMNDIRETAIIEQCVTLGGHARVRVELTLSALGGGAIELDVILLRLTAHYEEWDGLATGAGSTSSSPSKPESSQVLRAARARQDDDLKHLTTLRPKDLQGTWRVFSIAAAPVQELTVDGPKTQFTFNSIETEEKWVPRGSTPEELAEDGATMWLPGKVIVGLSMNPEKDTSSPSVRGVKQQEAPRALTVALGWMYEDGRITMIEREYNSSGDLKEVRMKSAVKGAWSGGRM